MATPTNKVYIRPDVLSAQTGPSQLCIHMTE